MKLVVQAILPAAAFSGGLFRLEANFRPSQSPAESRLQPGLAAPHFPAPFILLRLRFNQVEVPVAPADQDRDFVGHGIPVNQVVAGLVHLEQRLLQCHGLALLVMVDAVNPSLRSSSLGFGFRLGLGRPFRLRFRGRFVRRALVVAPLGGCFDRLLLQLFRRGVNRGEKIRLDPSPTNW